MTIIKRHFISILSVMLSAVLLVCILAWASLKPTFEKNNFTRIFQYQLKLKKELSNEASIIEFAGATKSSYFFKTTVPGLLLMTESNLENERYVNFQVPPEKKLSGYFNCFVDSPQVSILAGNIPAIIKIEPNSNPTLTHFPNKIFTRVVPLTRNSFIFRGLDSAKHSVEQVFYKGIPSTNTIIRENSISDKTQDGGISTDGLLSYDSTTNQVVYVFFYKNEFISMDTSLHLLYKANTVDKLTKNSNIKVGVIHSASQQNLLTNTEPDKDINSLSCVNGGKLFIMSKLKADNESDDQFGKNTIIDIYSVRSGNYISSFYIPRINFEKPISFKIIEKNVIAVYKSSIILYQMQN
jgi:hypothetical protein